MPSQAATLADGTDTRINARSGSFEEAFAAAGIPYQVRDGAFLRKPGPRSILQRLKRAGAGPLAEAVAAITDHLGYDPEASPDAGRGGHAPVDLGRMRSLAAEVRARAARRRSGVALLGWLTDHFTVTYPRPDPHPHPLGVGEEAPIEEPPPVIQQPQPF